MKEKLIQSGAIPVADTPAEFGKFLKADFDRWGKVVREKGIKTRADAQLLGRYSPVVGSRLQRRHADASGSLTRTGFVRSSSSLTRRHSLLNSLIRTTAPSAPRVQAKRQACDLLQSVTRPERARFERRDHFVGKARAIPQRSTVRCDSRPASSGRTGRARRHQRHLDLSP